jgi:hypothetical protein
MFDQNDLHTAIDQIKKHAWDDMAPRIRVAKIINFQMIIFLGLQTNR